MQTPRKIVGVGLALKPLRIIGAEIERRSPKDLAPLPLGPVPIEIRSGIRTLNRLFETVRATGDAQRRFLESAAHQLRTPLTGISAQLELMSTDEPDKTEETEPTGEETEAVTPAGSPVDSKSKIV